MFATCLAVVHYSGPFHSLPPVLTLCQRSCCLQMPQCLLGLHLRTLVLGTCHVETFYLLANTNRPAHWLSKAPACQSACIDGNIISCHIITTTIIIITLTTTATTFSFDHRAAVPTPRLDKTLPNGRPRPRPSTEPSSRLPSMTCLPRRLLVWLLLVAARPTTRVF